MRLPSVEELKEATKTMTKITSNSGIPIPNILSSLIGGFKYIAKAHGTQVSPPNDNLVQ